MKRKIKVDRVILFSDMQLWNSSGGWMMDKQLAPVYKQYCAKFGKTYLHCVDLAGYGKSVAPSGDKYVNCMSGFSEKILNRIIEFEGITEDGQKTKEVPPIEYIRENF